MKIQMQLREGLTNIFSAKLRSVLAMLGILVGTGAVVALITSSQLATTHALAQFKTLGTQLVSVNVSFNEDGRSHHENRTLTLQGVYQLENAMPEIEQIAPYASLFQRVVYRGETFQASVVGVTDEFFDVAKVKIAAGRGLSVIDKSNLYCVIGAKLAQALEKQGVFDPIGKQILVGSWFMTIVGVAQPWKPNLFVFLSLDEGVLVPIETASLFSANEGLNHLLVKLSASANLQATQNKLKKKLQRLVPAATLSIRNPQQILDLINKQQATFTWLLAAIGGISLFVGGIGVMNIMLVSVIERRREIGIRLAVGAHQHDILMLFLVEAMMLTLFGGILGIIVGLIISYVLAYLSQWEFYFFALPPILGFIVSVTVGLISGFYPALRASRLDPIQSLQEA